MNLPVFSKDIFHHVDCIVHSAYLQSLGPLEIFCLQSRCSTEGGAGHSHAGPATGGEKVNVKIWVQIEYLDIFM